MALTVVELRQQGFGDTLSLISGFVRTEDHGDNSVLEKNFVETSNYVELQEEEICYV
jgi:hypothetical protein